MSFFDRLPLRRRRPKGAADPRRWWRRHPVLSLAAVLVVLAAVVVIWRPWQSCGSGLTSVGSPKVCAGLALDSTEFKEDDQLADLEQMIAKHNAEITGDDFVTVVVLDDMTPDPQNDSAAFTTVRHGIQGAITAAWRANKESVAHGRTPPIKLLLANYGSGGAHAQEAVDAIVEARASQHIVAVTGFGQSLEATRKAASDLSDQRIASIGSLTSGDDMNQNPVDGKFIKRFFRVTPTNTDAATAAVSYVAKRGYKKVMLVQDTNGHDLYAGSLSKAFQEAYKTLSDKPPYTLSYESLDTPLNDISRTDYMTKRFADMRGEICLEKPDLIYFTGRGADLRSFLSAQAQGGACGLPSVDVLTGDDATSILGNPLPDFGDLPVNVLYTGVATKDEWTNAAPPEPDNTQNYNAFVKAFTEQGFGSTDDLLDGYVMMNHDAVLTAAVAARLNPSPVANPMTVADFLGEFNCRNPVPGASGKIAFTPASHGNAVNKAMPIMRIQQNGIPQLQDLTWASGKPFDATSCQ